MECPYCHEYLDMYEAYSTFRDDNILKIRKCFACYECDKNFWQEIIYTVTQEGELNEI